MVKKYAPLFLAILIMTAATACSSSANQEYKKSPTELLNMILKDVDLPLITSEEITNENFEDYFFIDPIDNSEAAATQAIVNSIPHMIAVLKVPESISTQAVAEQIKKRADKWNGRYPESTVISADKNVVVLIMSTKEIADKVSKNFNKLN